MDPRKRTTIIILIGLTLLLGVGSFLVTRLIQQQSQAPTTSAAAGFGENATRDVYDDVEEMFRDGGCEALISLDVISLYSPEDFLLTNATKFEEVPLSFPADRNASLNCGFTTNYGADFRIKVYTYNFNSIIDPNPQALYDRINVNLANNLLEGSVFGSDYFMGNDSNNASVCRLNLFHTQNDFEYITIELTNHGDGTSCQSQTNFMNELAYIIGYVANNYMREARARAQLPS